MCWLTLYPRAKQNSGQAHAHCRVIGYRRRCAERAVWICPNEPPACTLPFWQWAHVSQLIIELRPSLIKVWLMPQLPGIGKQTGGLTVRNWRPFILVQGASGKTMVPQFLHVWPLPDRCWHPARCCTQALGELQHCQGQRVRSLGQDLHREVMQSICIVGLIPQDRA